MYTQFFGNYLLQKEIITQDQLMDALSKMSESKVRLGTLALTKGMMTAPEIDECLYIQTQEDKRFGEIAIERGYLTEDQIKELLDEQVSDFMLLGQILVENQAITYEDLEQAIFDYNSETELYDLEMSIENNESIYEQIEKFFAMSSVPHNDFTRLYLELLFTSLIRFIGEDFTPLPPMTVEEYPATYAIGQRITGTADYMTYIDMDRDTAIRFASRYAKEEFTEFDDFVMASIADFINLHNGLFLVNASNQFGQEEHLEVASNVQGHIIPSNNDCILFPVVYPFGRINLIVSF